MGLNSVKIGGFDMYETYDLILASKKIPQPTPETKFVSVPSRNGSVDMSEVLGSLKYQDRTIEIKFLYIGQDILTKVSEVAEYLNGKRLKIIFDEDSNYYYDGRFSFNSITFKKDGGLITVKATCLPFKYSILDSTDDWLWDTFNFETGIINETGNITVSKSKTVSLYIVGKPQDVSITASTSMSVSLNGETFDLLEGTNKLYGATLNEGKNDFIFSGTGTISIIYREGLL